LFIKLAVKKIRNLNNVELRRVALLEINLLRRKCGAATLLTSDARTGTHLGPWPVSFGSQGPRNARPRDSATRTNVLNDNNDVTHNQSTDLTYICTIFCFVSLTHRRINSLT